MYLFVCMAQHICLTGARILSTYKYTQAPCTHSSLYKYIPLHPNKRFVWHFTVFTFALHARTISFTIYKNTFQAKCQNPRSLCEKKEKETAAVKQCMRTCCGVCACTFYMCICVKPAIKIATESIITREDTRDGERRRKKHIMHGFFVVVNWNIKQNTCIFSHVKTKMEGFGF